MRAIEKVTMKAIKTKDVGGCANTVEVTDAVLKELDDDYCSP